MVNTHIRNIDISTISRGVMKRTEEHNSFIMAFIMHDLPHLLIPVITFMMSES